MIRRGLDKETIDFLQTFYSVLPPWNYTEFYNRNHRSAPISGKRGDGRIFRIKNEKQIEKYFGIKAEEISISEISYDTGGMMYGKLTIYADNSYFLNEDLIVIMYSTQFSYKENEYLCVLDHTGKMISRQMLMGPKDFTASFNSQSFALKDTHHFANYTYAAYMPNVLERDLQYGRVMKYKNEDEPKTICTITDYEILEEGTIKKTGERIKYLKGNYWDYASYRKPLQTDDPILDY